jgi:crotonobetainyl-CoA:carnitine CoA-transferase CaiB-like acyl-CoA transferase
VSLSSIIPAGFFAETASWRALGPRRKPNAGQFIDVSLLQVAIAFIESHVADYLNGGEAVVAGKFSPGRHLQPARLAAVQTLHGSSFGP